MSEDRLPRISIRDEYTPAVYNDPDLLDRIVPVLNSTLGGNSVTPVDPVMVGE
jgi:hippurate hydrolase